MLLNKTRRKQVDYTWPGFVDALSSLLMVIIFVLMIFVLSQFFLSQKMSGQDEALIELRNNLSELGELLSLERDVTTKWLDLLALTSSAVAKQEEVDALNELYESVFEEWKLGGKTSLDTDQAYQNFLNSEVELVAITTDILIAKFDLLAEIGTLKVELE